jgi:hypothetical protein
VDSGSESSDNNEDGKISPEENAVDFGGREIIFGYSLEIQIPREGWMQYDIFKALEKKYNFVWKPEFSTIDYTQSLKLHSMAGTEYRDILSAVQFSIYPWAPKQDYLTVLDPYFAEADSNINRLNLESTKWFGVQYGVLANTGLEYNNTLWFNRTILEKEGLPDLQELFMQNEWTWEKYLDIAIAATRDFNGDGLTDQWGISAPAVTWFWDQLVSSNGGTWVATKNDGKAEFNAYDRKLINALQFAVDLLNVYKVISFGPTDFNRQVVAMSHIGIGQGAGYLKDRKNFGFVHVPRGPDVDKYVVHNRTWTSMWVIPTNAKDPDKLFKMICDSTLMAELPEYNPDLLLPKVDLVAKNLKAKWLWDDIQSSQYYSRVRDMVQTGEVVVNDDMWQIVGLGTIINNLFSIQIVRDRVSVSSALESAYPLGQQVIDSYFSQ